VGGNGIPAKADDGECIDQRAKAATGCLTAEETRECCRAASKAVSCLAPPIDTDARPRYRSIAMRRMLLVLLLAASTLASADPLTDAVERMARVGRAFSPTFSPDGKRIAFVSDLSGTPQIWVVSAQGGWPVQVTNGIDPVSFAVWSPVRD